MNSFPDHAQQRCAQRNLSTDVLNFVKQHGQKIRRTGVVFYFLGRRDIPERLRSDDRYARLEGTILLVGPDGRLITTYRNRKAIKTIRRKTKYRLPAWGQCATGPF